MSSVTITVRKPLGLQVCSDETDMEKLTHTVNIMEPCGTTMGWVLADDDERAPVVCADDPARKHYVFDA